MKENDKLKGKTKLFAKGKARFRAIEIWCWIQKKAGLTYKQIAQKAGIAEITAFRHVEKIQNALSGALDIEDYRNLAFFGNIHQALDNLGLFLQEARERPTMDFLRGVGILREYVHEDSSSKTASEEEIRERIRTSAEALGFGLINGSTPASRISPAVVSSDPSPEHKE
jgi:transcriptional regulator with XRE-family HTH domain